MYCLEVKLGNNVMSGSYNGDYMYYTNDNNRLNNVLDLLKLLLLKDISIEYCVCSCCLKEINDGEYRTYKHINSDFKCKHCTNSLDSQINILDIKNDYIFYIDVYKTRHNGSEEILRLQDFDTLINYHYPKAKELYGIDCEYPFIYEIYRTKTDSNLLEKIIVSNTETKTYTYDAFIQYLK